jgi:TetR/AcrR family transcriptional regulator, cholesterol catabolism regulator
MVESIDREASREAFPEASREITSRRERKRERTRGEIYSAAMNLFLRRGFEAVTIEEICDAADVARATFFLHFPAKEALLTEYGARANQALAELLRASHGTATATLKAALKMLAERAMQQPDVIRLHVRELLSRPPVFLQSHQEQTENLVSLLAAVIRRGQAAGEFRRKIEPALAAVALCATYFALIYEWARRGGKLDVEGAIAQTLDIVLNGLSDKKSRRVSA